MCRRIIERYSVCKCIYYEHSIDKCPMAHAAGHVVEDKVVLIGYACPAHMPPPENLKIPNFPKPGFGMNTSPILWSRATPSMPNVWEDALGTGSSKKLHEFRPQIGGQVAKKGGISMQANWQPGSNLRQEYYRKVESLEKQSSRGLLSKELKTAEEPEPEAQDESHPTSFDIFRVETPSVPSQDTPQEWEASESRIELPTSRDSRNPSQDTPAGAFTLGPHGPVPAIISGKVDLLTQEEEGYIDEQLHGLVDQHLDSSTPNFDQIQQRNVLSDQSSISAQPSAFPQNQKSQPIDSSVLLQDEQLGEMMNLLRSNDSHGIDSEYQTILKEYNEHYLEEDYIFPTADPEPPEISYLARIFAKPSLSKGSHDPHPVHEDPEPKLHLCPKNGCEKSVPGNGFLRISDLRRHVKKVHENALVQDSEEKTPIEKEWQAFDDKPLEVPKEALADHHITTNPPEPLGTEASSILNYLRKDGLLEIIDGSWTLDQWFRDYQPRIIKDFGKGDDKTRQKMFIHLQQYLESAPPSKSNFGHSREALLKKYHKFRQKAAEAFRKLENASLYRSEDFDRFVFQDLQTVDNVIDIGQSTLYNFIDRKMQKPPDNLTSLYCMLHVCYAMSQASDTNAPEVTDVQFAKSASEWKHCITADTDPKLRRQKQDLFDELVEVMWDEFKEGLEYAMQFEDVFNTQMDPVFDSIGVFDTNDPGFVGWNPPSVDLNWDSYVNMDDLSSESTFDVMALTPFESVSGTSHTISPIESGPSPPSWEALMASSFITAALNFIEELKETGIVFLYLCGSIAVSTIRHFTNASTTPAPEPAKPNSNERQDILNSLIPYSTNIKPIIKMVAKPFLTGVIDTFNDLEECMVAFLKIISNDPHSFLCSFTLLTSHFYTYYHQHLPQHLKCENDGYNSPTYVSERIRAEENCFIPNRNNEVYTNQIKKLNTQLSNAQRDFVISAETPVATPRARKRKSQCDEEDGLAMKACMKKFRCGMGPKPVKPRTEFVFKVMTGEPPRRKNKQR
ncbi:hypothetical protein TWF694_009023 [Orbilia ellipsospora]|uniref:C2H2-domain containing protein second zinc finger domain-containing protein n=1 Tax=Orbilia ellipsospora TaxID=2528407 RepID=A0AAV9XDM2_9PEZI